MNGRVSRSGCFSRIGSGSGSTSTGSASMPLLRESLRWFLIDRNDFGFGSEYFKDWIWIRIRLFIYIYKKKKKKKKKSWRSDPDLGQPGSVTLRKYLESNHLKKNIYPHDVNILCTIFCSITVKLLLHASWTQGFYIRRLVRSPCAYVNLDLLSM